MINHISNNIKKNKKDDREFRYLRLSNGIKCMIVHDKDAEKSGACLHVASGSLKDP